MGADLMPSAHISYVLRDFNAKSGRMKRNGLLFAQLLPLEQNVTGRFKAVRFVTKRVTGRWNRLRLDYSGDKLLQVSSGRKRKHKPKSLTQPGPKNDRKWREKGCSINNPAAVFLQFDYTLVFTHSRRDEREISDKSNSVCDS